MIAPSFAASFYPIRIIGRTLWQPGVAFCGLIYFSVIYTRYAVGEPG
ncbi:hypothetical protein SBA3_2080006 [Candidatus Sulfopaludibacter sp. SbA3]|nr:hypothetical protein SBA3_2080006 [Candidatus Sulfopaludibacter sp. SbA3]